MERLLDYFVPERYTLDLVIDKHKKTIGGTVVIKGVAKAENIKFHAVGLSVDEVLVNGKKVDFEVENGVLTLIKVPRSEIRVEIGYHGSLNENMQGAYLSTYEYQGRTEVIVATQFESHYAREAFPCIDEPAAKAVFELAITVPDGDDVVLSNTLESSNIVSDFKTTVFQPTPRMSTYLLAWVIGKFHGKIVTNEHGTKITTYCALNQDIDSVDFANEIAAKSLEFYDDNFGVPYPLEKLDQVALPDFEAGAMENWGLVTYRESLLLAGQSATMDTKKGVALTVAHELSHQWFGDLVTMEWWDDLWLNESFASVMEYFAVDDIYPEYRIFERFFTGDCYGALIRDAYSDVQSVHQEVSDPEEIATLFDGAIVYSKGARLMLMLIRLMGWEQFCEGVADYFEKYRYKNTVGDNLWESLEPYAKFNPKELMHAFIDQPGYPVVTSEGGDFEKFRQRRFLLDGDEMPESNWALPEVKEDMSGHYILNLTDVEFGERMEKFEQLGLEERLRLLIDRGLVCRTDLVPTASLISLLDKFRNEDSAAVWQIIARLIKQLKCFFEVDSPEEKQFKKFVGRLVADKLVEIGLTTKENDDTDIIQLRAILLGLDYYAETVENLQELAGYYDEQYEKLDAETRADVLAAKIYCDAGVTQDYIEAYKKITDPEIKFDLLFAMTLARDEENLKKAVELLEQTDVVKPQDQLYLYIYLYRNPRVHDLVWDWLTHHWDDVRRMTGDKSLDSYPRLIANVVQTRAEYEKWREFFWPMKENLALKRAIMIGDREILARLALIQKDRDTVIRFISTKVQD